MYYFFASEIKNNKTQLRVVKSQSLGKHQIYVSLRGKSLLGNVSKHHYRLKVPGKIKQYTTFLVSKLCEL